MEPKMEMRMEHKVERIALALERIADALEKQDAGNQMDLEDSKFIPEDSNGPCKPGPSQRCSP